MGQKMLDNNFTRPFLSGGHRLVVIISQDGSITIGIQRMDPDTGEWDEVERLPTITIHE